MVPAVFAMSNDRLEYQRQIRRPNDRRLAQALTGPRVPANDV
jgi:hypothetical protein